MKRVALLALLGSAGCSLVLAGDLDDARDPVLEAGAPVTIDAGDGASSADAPAAIDAGDAAASAYAKEVLADMPAAYWRFEDEGGPTLRDELGARPLTIVDAKSLEVGVAGVGGSRAIRSDGNAHYDVEVPSDPFFTIEVWVRPTYTDEHYGIVFEKNKIVNEIRDGMLLWVNPKREVGVAFEVWANAGVAGAALGDPAPLPRDHFTHLVVTRDTNGSCHLYVDGKETGATDEKTNIPVSSPTLAFGSGLVGDMDEVALYRGALRPERIAAHYEAGR